MNVTPHELKELLTILSEDNSPACTEQKPAGLELFIAQPDGVKFIGQPVIEKHRETSTEVTFLVTCPIQTPNSTRLTA
jgi:hypothetical protein